MGDVLAASTCVAHEGVSIFDLAGKKQMALL